MAVAPCIDVATSHPSLPIRFDSHHATVHCVKGKLCFYYYGCDGFKDHGWGCIVI
eukprot:m.160134 g.160134  ORF g.160134 m.160134 type:complete len:55 (+) comp18014_c0_seq1:263-427(+)